MVETKKTAYPRGGKDMAGTREFYRLYKVNSFEEEIDYINKEFTTEKEAWNWLKNVEHIKSRKNWRCELVVAVPAVVGKSFTQIVKEAGL